MGRVDPSEFEVEDSAFGYVKFKNGATVIIETSWALNIAESGGNLLCGTKGGADFAKMNCGSMASGTGACS